MATARTPWGVTAAATAFLLPVAFSPSVNAPFWSPKAAVLVVAGAAGCTRLPALLRSPLRRPALAAIAFLAVGALSTALSGDPVQATFGLYNWGTGLVYLACLAGVWAMGAAAADSRDTVLRWLVVGCGVSAAVGLVQSAIEVPAAVLEDPGRAIGLAGNANHLGSLAVVGAVAAAWLATGRRSWLGAVALFAAAVQVSGTRAALAGATLGVVAVGFVRARRLVPALVAVTVLGLGAGTLLAEVGDSETASARTATSTDGIRTRIDLWRVAGEAATERPVVGSGPGRFRSAVVPHRTLAQVRAASPNALPSDAHNLLVEHAVTTGVLGVAALGAWLWAALRRARGALLAAALALLAMSLVQPQSIGTTPLLFLAAGAGAVGPVPRSGRLLRWATPPAVIGGVTAAGLLLAGDQALFSLRETFDLSHARRADVLLRPWPQPATIVARAYEFRALGEPDDDERAALRAEVRRWRRRAIGRDSTDPALHRTLAADEQVAGLLEEADATARTALEHNPFDVLAMRLLADIALDRGDEEAAIAWLERADAIRPDRSATRLLDELRAQHAK